MTDTITSGDWLAFLIKEGRLADAQRMIAAQEKRLRKAVKRLKEQS